MFMSNKLQMKLVLCVLQTRQPSTSELVKKKAEIIKLAESGIQWRLLCTHFLAIHRLFHLIFHIRFFIHPSFFLNFRFENSSNVPRHHVCFYSLKFFILLLLLLCNTAIKPNAPLSSPFYRLKFSSALFLICKKNHLTERNVEKKTVFVVGK